MDEHLIKLSKFLSLILRHKPQVIGLTLDDHGWADVEDLIDRVNLHGIPISFELLTAIVHSNDKQRFAFNHDASKIRAHQGHSIAIEYELATQQPPEQLFHGTATRFLAAIRSQGLVRGERQHVHLSADELTAIRVGQRHGSPVVLKIAALEMYQAGYRFFVAENGVWLTESVPPRYIDFSGTPGGGPSFSSQGQCL